MTATIDTVVLRRDSRRDETTPRPRRATPRPQPASKARRADTGVPSRAPDRDPARPRRARTGVFAALVLSILTVGLLGMLVVNTALAEGAFVVSELERRQAALVETEQSLREEVALASAPGRLEEAARALGMVPQEVPAFLRLSDGAVLGNAIPQPAPIAEDNLDLVDATAVDATAVDPTAVDPIATDPTPVDAVDPAETTDPGEDLP